jgi:hypothetical protein
MSISVAWILYGFALWALSLVTSLSVLWIINPFISWIPGLFWIGFMFSAWDRFRWNSIWFWVTLPLGFVSAAMCGAFLRGDL